jgi:hypothetical protein
VIDLFGDGTGLLFGVGEVGENLSFAPVALAPRERVAVVIALRGAVNSDNAFDLERERLRAHGADCQESASPIEKPIKNGDPIGNRTLRRFAEFHKNADLLRKTQDLRFCDIRFFAPE